MGSCSREIKPGRGDTRQGTENLPPDMREVFKGRVKFDLFDLRPALGERPRYQLQALAVGGRNAIPGNSLDGGHVDEARGRIGREGAVPTGLVPLCPANPGACGRR